MPSRSAFTLIELLVVIAIIAILAVVVVLTLNPAELLRQSRDANRLSDLATISSAINLYNTDQSGSPAYSLGAASTTYISFFDPSATSTAGTNCGTLGIPATTTGWNYQCPASSTYRSVNSQGWLPINFSRISAGSPFGALPIDPSNNTSSLLYYEYMTNDSQYSVVIPLESTKYLKQNLLITDVDPFRVAEGSNPSLVTQEEGLIGYWPLTEGSGMVAYDQSGSANNGGWVGTSTYGAGKIGAFAATISSGNYISVPDNSSYDLPGLQTFSVAAWFYETGYSTGHSSIVSKGAVGSCNIGYDLLTLGSSSNKSEFIINDGGSCAGQQQLSGASAVPLNSWHQIVGTYDGTTARLYLDGAFLGSKAMSLPTSTNPAALWIGQDVSSGYLVGSVNDVRLYSRPLSAAEIQALYNAED